MMTYKINRNEEILNSNNFKDIKSRIKLLSKDSEGENEAGYQR